MEVFHFYDFIVMAVFILLVVLSLNEIVLVQLERDLGNHMVIEHMLFFSRVPVSICRRAHFEIHDKHRKEIFEQD